MHKIIGIDIGGSKIRAVLWDGKKVLKVREIKTPENLTALKRALRRLIDNLTPTKIGIAVPGRVKGTTFVSATNLPYIRNLNFREIFQNLNIKVDHDARCFARAELIGNAEGKLLENTSILFLTLGTGVGRAVGEIKNGKPVIRRVREFEYPERWEKEYQKIRDSGDNRALASFLAKKLAGRFKEFRPKIIIVGGGVGERKGFLAELQKAFEIPVKKARFGKNSVAIGAAMLFV